MLKKMIDSFVTVLTGDGNMNTAYYEGRVVNVDEQFIYLEDETNTRLVSLNKVNAIQVPNRKGLFGVDRAEATIEIDASG